MPPSFAAPGEQSGSDGGAMSPSVPLPVTETGPLARYRGGAEIHHRLIEGGSFQTDRLVVSYHVTCDELESLQTRLQRRDPTMGLIDPTRLVKSGGDARDVARVAFLADGVPEQAFDVYIYLAHLVTQESLFRDLCLTDGSDGDASDEDTESADDPKDTEAFERGIEKHSDPSNSDDAIVESFFLDGSFTGTLLWDASLRLCDLVLSRPFYRRKLKNANVVELGCGVGLLGLLSAFLNCRSVALTDRESLRGLCEENIATWRRTFTRARSRSRVASERDAKVSEMCFSRFEWTDPDDAENVKRALGNRRVDVVFAADCIFNGLFGSPAPLIDALLGLCDPETVVLLATERRPNDGVEAFREIAEGRFSRKTVRVFGPDGGDPVGGVGDVVVEELRMK